MVVSREVVMFVILGVVAFLVHVLRGYGLVDEHCIGTDLGRLISCAYQLVVVVSSVDAGSHGTTNVHGGRIVTMRGGLRVVLGAVDVFILEVILVGVIRP